MSFKEKWNRMNRKADQAIKNAKARKTAQPDTDNTGRKEKKPGGHKVLRAIAAVCLVGIMLMCVAGCVLTVWAFDTLNTDQQMLDLSMQKAKYTTIFYADDGETELARAYDPDAGNRIWWTMTRCRSACWMPLWRWRTNAFGSTTAWTSSPPPRRASAPFCRRSV